MFFRFLASCWTVRLIRLFGGNVLFPSSGWQNCHPPEPSSVTLQIEMGCKSLVTPHVVDCVWNVMAHAQKPDFVFRRNERVHLNRRGRQLSRLLAAEVCASAVVMLDTPCSEVVWRVLATYSIRQFPFHFPSHASPVPSHSNWTLTTYKTIIGPCPYNVWNGLQLFLLFKISKLPPPPPQRRMYWRRGLLLPLVKRPRREADQSPTFALFSSFFSFVASKGTVLPFVFNTVLQRIKQQCSNNCQFFLRQL